MTTLVQIPPATVPFLNRDGSVAQPWRNFLDALVTRAGGIAGAVQPEDPTLTALAALSASAGVLVQTGADTFTKVAGKASFTGAVASITIVDGVVTAIS